MKARIVIHLPARVRRQRIQCGDVHESRGAAKHVEAEMLETALDGVRLVPVIREERSETKRGRT